MRAACGAFISASVEPYPRDLLVVLAFDLGGDINPVETDHAPAAPPAHIALVLARTHRGMARTDPLGTRGQLDRRAHLAATGLPDADVPAAVGRCRRRGKRNLGGRWSDPPSGWRRFRRPFRRRLGFDPINRRYRRWRCLRGRDRRGGGGRGDGHRGRRGFPNDGRRATAGRQRQRRRQCDCECRAPATARMQARPQALDQTNERQSPAGPDGHRSKVHGSQRPRHISQ